MFLHCERTVANVQNFKKKKYKVANQNGTIDKQ